LTQRYKIDAAKLARALEAALRSAKPEVRTIVRERVSLNEQMDLVLKIMRREGRASFFALVANGDRFTIIVTFLGVLELVRRGRIIVAQAAAFDDIDLLPGTPAEVAHAR
jgi:segregation and condensation protein A